MNLAIQCPKCGRYTGKTMTNIDKANLKCPCCGKSSKFRSRGIYLNHKKISDPSEIGDLNNGINKKIGVK